MKVFCRHKRAGASLAVIALLGNLLAILLVCVTAPNVDGFWGPRVICTANGANALPPDPGGPCKSKHCPGYIPVVDFIPNIFISLIAAAFPPSNASGGLSLNALLLPLHLALGGIHSRAPPLTVSLSSSS
jgi:hypothetical protein